MSQIDASGAVPVPQGNVGTGALGLIKEWLRALKDKTQYKTLLKLQRINGLWQLDRRI